MSRAWITIHTDGSALGNPGPAGWGAVLKYGHYVKKINGYLGHCTSNQAEMWAVIKALQALKKNNLLITMYTDSQVVVFGYQGRFKLRANLDLWSRIFEETEKHKEVIINWIPRQQNFEADKLANQGARNV